MFIPIASRQTLKQRLRVRDAGEVPNFGWVSRAIFAI